MKSPYLKCGGGSSVSGYLRHIDTWERVEILPDDRPPTRKQEQLIKKLTRDFLEARELGEYVAIFFEIALNTAKMEAVKKVYQVQIKDKTLVSMNFCISNNAFLLLKCMRNNGFYALLFPNAFLIVP